jgi:hypothetical protein
VTTTTACVGTRKLWIVSGIVVGEGCGVDVARRVGVTVIGVRLAVADGICATGRGVCVAVAVAVAVDVAVAVAV